ncbi:MAG: iron ABC transporter permease, partial [Janthinobacterium lividum]
MLLPLIYIAVRAYQAGPSGVASDLLRPYTLGLLVNTVFLAGSVTILACGIATAAAWVTERSDLPGRRWWRLATALPLA